MPGARTFFKFGGCLPVFIKLYLPNTCFIYSASCSKFKAHGTVGNIFISSELKVATKAMEILSVLDLGDCNSSIGILAPLVLVSSIRLTGYSVTPKLFLVFKLFLSYVVVFNCSAYPSKKNKRDIFSAVFWITLFEWDISSIINLFIKNVHPNLGSF